MDPSVHGNGPVEVSVSGFLTEIDPLVEATSKELGGRFAYNVDYNSGNFVGTCELITHTILAIWSLTPCIAYMQSSIGGGERSSAATAYLTSDVRNRTNLDILINTQVTRLINVASSGSTPDLRTVEYAQSRDGKRPLSLTTPHPTNH